MVAGDRGKCGAEYVFERIDGKASAAQSAAPPRDLIIIHTFKSNI